MPLKRSSPFPILLSLFTLPLASPERLPAQDAGPAATLRVPATIVLADEPDGLPQGAVLLRRDDLHPHDVVMVAPREATAELLSAAVFTLLAARSLLGDVPAETHRIPVLRASGPRAWRRHVVPRLERLLDELRSAEPRAVSGIGVVRSLTVWLPAGYPIGLKGSAAPGTELRNR